MGRRFQGIRALWSRRDFRHLCGSQVLGGLGEWLATMALIGIVWERTHSAFASGIVLALRILPAALLSSLLGAVVERFDRRRVLVACTAGRACIYGSLPLVGGVAPVLALALLAEVGTLAYVAARDATLPRLVPEESLPTANAISMASSFASMPFGSGLFAALVWIQGRSGRPGMDLALLVAAGMLGLATVLLRRMTAHSVRPATAASADDGVEPQAGRTLREVFGSDPVLRRVAVGAAIVACCGGSLLTLGLAYVRGTLHAGPAAYSGLLTAFCFGAVAGVAALHKAGKHLLPRLFHSATVVMGVILFAMALFPSKPMGYSMAFIFGGAFVATFLGGVTILQQRVDDGVRARAFAIAHSGLRVGAVGVGLLAAWGARSLGVGRVLWTMDGTQVVLGAAGLALFIAGAALFPRPQLRAASA